MKNTKIIVLIVSLAMIVGIQALAEGVTQYPTYTGDVLQITPREVVVMGFTDPEELAVTKSNTNFNNLYFTVTESVTGENGKAWGKNANVVAVFYRPIPIGHGQQIDTVEYREYAGRTQAYVYGPNYYVVVTGPDKQKVTNLINLIRDILS